MAKVKLGVIIYKEKDEEGEYYIAVEPLSGAQVQADTIEEALEKIKEEVKKMSSAWCESELREAVDARMIEVDLEEATAE